MTFEGSFEEAADELGRAVERSVVAAVGRERRVAVAFSGGLDSSMLAVCAKRHSEVLACTGFAEGALDSVKAAEAAKAIGVEFVATRLTTETVEAEAAGLGRWSSGSLMDRSLWCLYSAVSRKAAEEGAGTILLGQLSDELFGGYAKYQKALDERGEGTAEEMMRKDVAEYSNVGRARDVDACSRWLQPKFPFEEGEVVGLGLSLPVSFKIRDGVRKAVLRKAAELIGVPEAIAGVPKKAAQYSSGIQKLLG